MRVCCLAIRTLKLIPLVKEIEEKNQTGGASISIDDNFIKKAIEVM
jgi:hypothetical protein